MSKTLKAYTRLTSLAALLFLHSFFSPALSQVILNSPNQDNLIAEGLFGRKAASVPDITGDGVDEFAIGATEESIGSVDNVGRVYVYDGATNTLLHTLEPENVNRDRNFGISISGVPDTNGDGAGEILVGAVGYLSVTGPDEEGSGEYSGRALLFDGASGALIQEIAPPVFKRGIGFGRAVSGVPDADGDGYGDILVGSPREDTDFVDSGKVYLFSGSDGTLLLTLESPNAEEYGRFGGFAVEGIDDINGDNSGDLIVSAPFEGTTVEDRGRVYLFDGVTGSLILTVESPGGSERFGNSLSSISDLDGDNVSDLIIGSFLEGSSLDRTGKVYVFSTSNGQLIHTLGSPNAEESGVFGSSVSGIADVNQDLVSDILVGAYGESPDGVEDAGRAYVFSGLDGTLLRTLEPLDPQIDGLFGTGVAGVGTAGGMTTSLVVGAGFANERYGEAYVFESQPTADCTPAVILRETFSGSEGRVLFYSPDGIEEVTFTLLDNVQVVSVAGENGETFTSESETYTSNQASGNHPTQVESILSQVDPDVPEGAYFAKVGTTCPEEEDGILTVDFDPPLQFELPHDKKTGISFRHPNPTRGPLNVGVSVAGEEKIDLMVYDAQGRKVAQLLDNVTVRGTKQIRWNGVSELGLPVGSGVYYLYLRSTKRTQTASFIIVR